MLVWFPDGCEKPIEQFFSQTVAGYYVARYKPLVLASSSPALLTEVLVEKYKKGIVHISKLDGESGGFARFLRSLFKVNEQ
jgi:hypothetical protein